MLACELSAIIGTCLEIPASVCTCLLAVRKRSHCAAWLEHISLVKIRVTHSKAVTFLERLIVDSLLEGIRTLVLLPDVHVGVITTLHTEAEAFCDEVESLRNGKVEVECSVVLLLVTHIIIGHVTATTGSGRSRAITYISKRNTVHHTRAGIWSHPKSSEDPHVIIDTVILHRLVCLTDHSADVQLHVCSLCELEVEVCTVVITVVREVVVI